jgi:sphingosine kinase
MAKSLLHAANEACSISDALFAIIRGHKQALDVCTIVQGEKKIFSVLSVTWGKYQVWDHGINKSLFPVQLLWLLYLTLWGKYSGLVADIDIESEKYRWMGSARFDFYVCIHIFFRSL